MKKYLILLLLSLFAYASFADTYKYRATNYAYKYKKDNGYWTNWSEWERSSLLIVISSDNDKIDIYSEKPQEYDIYDYGEGWKSDGQGGQTLTMKCVNDDGLRCEVRLRQQSDGQWQLYVDFNDMMWVYSIVQK